MNKIRWLSLYA